ncbi:3-deoxy-D-manno-octulosonic acid transferase [Thiomicrorhabdus arctica]|uniref:3-deoxy-D-manno-octulosonic acid transferase n=1 Tax=Thiomicrorhabdus arctica TaxID=131540 RepID=UPI00037B01D9|nr:3-deoxy-D-manno-octulosonic acid transferase [Thiomicrorhabdus arctica]
MNLFTYRFLTTLALPLIAYSGWKRCRKHLLEQAKHPELPDIVDCFRSRFGFNRQKMQTGGIWIHAVSVGETRSIFPLLSRLKQDHPNRPLTLTSGSTQGALQALQFSPVQIQHQMIPYDYAFAVNRFLDQLQPQLVIMVETEIWPNLYQACSERKIPIMLINARLKEQSFLAYKKWGGKMLSNALNQTQLIAAQFPIDAQHFESLGVNSQKIKVLGSLKFDLNIPPGLVKDSERWKSENQLDHRFIWVAASTHAHPQNLQDSEEQRLLQAHQQLLANRPDALLILAPRHPERFDEVAAQIKASGLNFARRSLSQDITANTQVYLADSVGELMLWFSAGDVAFIGGSLVPFGGHNILEPAALKKPVLSGPHFANLQALYDSFMDDEALTIVNDTTALGRVLIKLTHSSDSRQALGELAYQSFSRQSGTLDLLMQEIQPLIK